MREIKEKILSVVNRSRNNLKIIDTKIEKNKITIVCNDALLKEAGEDDSDENNIDRFDELCELIVPVLENQNLKEINIYDAEKGYFSITFIKPS